MQKLFLSILILATVLFSNTFNVSAWDDVGHKITGYIAWQRMSPTARENVIKILRAAPEDSDISTFFMGFGPKSDEEKRLEYFMFMPTWADVVRDRSFPVRFGKYHKSDWHYTSVFWRQVDGKAVLDPGKAADGQAIIQLANSEKVMRDAAVANADKAVALAWFLHLGGDIHQPLHTSSRVTDREAEGDRGGNTFLLTPEGTKRDDQVNLHWFWDSIVGRNVPYNAGLCESDYVRNIAESMMLRYTFDAEKGRLALSSYPAWKDESLKLAQTDVFRSDLKRFETPSDDYRRNAFTVSERRLTLAGYRMGETLNEIFGK
jgi:hypothetical protein